MKNINLQNIKLYPQYSGLTEYWADIKDYEGLYQISNFGRVKSLSRKRKNINNINHTVQEKILKTSKDNRGYNRVVLCANLEKTFRIHRLVAQTFIPNLNDYPQVNHIDGCKTNNNLYNLEWCTAKENVQHAFRTNLVKINSMRGSKCHASKLTEADVLIIKKRIITGDILKDIAIDYNVSISAISSIKSGRTWKQVFE